MNQHDQMREALQALDFIKVAATPQSGITYQHIKAIEQALAAKHSPLVRLMDDQIEEIGRKLLDRGHPWEGLQPWVYVFAKCIMDAMQEKNK